MWSTIGFVKSIWYWKNTTNTWTSIIFLAITDSNNTNTHTKTLNNTVNTQYNVYIMTWIWYNEKKNLQIKVHVIAKI